MRILHTADWHIGAKTDDLDRFPEQKEALKQVIAHAKNYNVDMVLISGDIYDNLVPSAEDEELFYKTVVELSRNGNCAVVAIAGNHDDPKRLSNANIFADKFGIYLVGNLDEIKVDLSRKEGNIYPTRSGKINTYYYKNTANQHLRILAEEDEAKKKEACEEDEETYETMESYKYDRNGEIVLEGEDIIDADYMKRLCSIAESIK
jgi:exonuclease SbcD